MALMYGVTSPSNPASQNGVSLQRAKGAVSSSFYENNGETCIKTLRQSGCGKARLPNVFGTHYKDLVCINTSGGLTGGDRFSFDVTLEAGTKLRSTTQACEKIYRASADHATVSNTLRVSANASLHWLPQETIFFDSGALDRRLHVDLSAGSELIAFESFAFGRKAMGETEIAGSLRDSWRIHIDGRLAYAEEASLSGAISEKLQGFSSAGGNGVTISGVVIGPNLVEKRERLRAELEEEGARSLYPGLVWGCSLRRDVLVFRAIATDTLVFRTWMSKLYYCLSGLALPRPWNC